jgi:hypothetical protein
MTIKNKELTVNEKKWLELILSKNFLYREEVINHINRATIIREYTDYYLALKFQVKDIMPPIPTKIRVPVEMRVSEKEQVPIQFLLHVVEGYVAELEVFKSDSSKINADLILIDGGIEILVNPEMAC